jgi:hypothetical protein
MRRTSKPPSCFGKADTRVNFAKLPDLLRKKQGSVAKGERALAETTRAATTSYDIVLYVTLLK